MINIFVISRVNLSPDRHVYIGIKFLPERHSSMFKIEITVSRTQNMCISQICFVRTVYMCLHRILYQVCRVFCQRKQEHRWAGHYTPEGIVLRALRD